MEVRHSLLYYKLLVLYHKALVRSRNLWLIWWLTINPCTKVLSVYNFYLSYTRIADLLCETANSPMFFLPRCFWMAFCQVFFCQSFCAVFRKSKGWRNRSTHMHTHHRQKHSQSEISREILILIVWLNINCLLLNRIYWYGLLEEIEKIK